MKKDTKRVKKDTSKGEKEYETRVKEDTKQG
jgi:hypothetical protein